MRQSVGERLTSHPPTIYDVQAHLRGKYINFECTQTNTYINDGQAHKANMYINNTACVFHTQNKYLHILQYVDMYGCSVCYVFGMVVWVPVSLEEGHNKK